MIRSLELTNYRGFEHYKLSNLARVNLLVGKNNSGKTSILEAVQLLATGGDLRELANLARQRGELISGAPELSTKQTRIYSDVSHFFHGHAFDEGSTFSLTTDGELGDMTIRVVRLEYDEHRKRRAREEAPQAPKDLAFITELGVMSEYQDRKTPPTKRRSFIPTTEEGGVSLDWLRLHARTTQTKAGDRPVQFIPQDSLNRRLMSELSDQVTIEGREEDVAEAMRILDPNFSSFAFLSSDPSYGRDPRGGIVVGFKGGQRRYPLGSHGEGMRRLLAIALCLATTKDGVLLIDEVDTGLHYSVLGDVWLLIVEAAKRYNIQVFLTTHSLDCIRGLGWLCEAYPELAPEISLQKIERALDEAVAFSADQVQIAVEQDIEVR